MPAPITTGFVLNPTASQYFSEGPSSGSVVDSSFDVSLYVSASSFVSLNGYNFFYKIYDPETCALDPGCGKGQILNVYTGSQSGYYSVRYSTGSSNAASASIDVSGVYNFNTAFGSVEETTFKPVVNVSGTGSVSITSSFIDNRVYFRYFNSCSVLSDPSTPYILNVTDNTPPSPNYLNVKFNLTPGDFDPNNLSLLSNYGQTTILPSYTVSWQSSATNTSSLATYGNNSSFVVTSGGATRVYSMAAGETVTFTLSYPGYASLDGSYRFNRVTGPSMAQNAQDILGKVAINSTIFPSTNLNYSLGSIVNAPKSIVITANPNLPEIYNLEFDFYQTYNP